MTAQAPERTALTFPDGARWRIEIPSVEGPEALEAVIEEAHARSVPVHRVSQGSGISMLTDGEIQRMAQLGEEHRIEVCLWAGGRAGWETGAQTPGASAVRGRAALTAALEEVTRATSMGIKSVLVADVGLLAELGRARRSADLPAELLIKVSIMAGPANPASFALLAELGADTVNVPSDLSVTQLAELRESALAVIDFYIEAPGNVGGQMRYTDVQEIVDAAAPIHLKFGLRNAPDVYPAGTHLQASVLACSRERVRRAELALNRLVHGRARG